MSKSEKALFGNSWTDETVTQGPALILEKYLSATLQLCWRVEQERIRSSGATPTKTRLLFDGLAGELQSFIASIQKRLKLWTRKKPAVTELDQSSYWRLFPVDSYDLRDQLEFYSAAMRTTRDKRLRPVQNFNRPAICRVQSFWPPYPKE